MAETRVNKTLKEYGRGVIGGLLFSLPLLYTMELWWMGFMASPEKLLAFIGITLVLLMGYNRYAGMREDAGYWEILRDSVEEIALAFTLSFLFLWLIAKIDFEMSFDEIAGKVIVESMIVAIGISVGTSQLGQGNGKDTGMQRDGKNKDKKQELSQLWILSFCGAALFSSAVAPTEEIMQIALAANYLHLLLMVFFSLGLGFVVLYYSDFKNTGTQAGLWEITLHVIIGYTAALIISFLFLWFFQSNGSGMEYAPGIVMAQVVVLSIPGILGASAGRLLIK